MAYTTIKKPSDYFNTKLYTGNGSTQSITGVNFQPDLSWIKSRTTTDTNAWYDAVRGATKRIKSNSTDAETTQSTALTSFDSDGFSIGAGGDVNTNSANYVSWNWLGDNGTASNTDGSITSTVSANTTSGFSIVSYTGTGSVATVGHGLGAIPDMITVKNLSTGSTNWRSIFPNMVLGGASNGADYNLNLNTTNPWNDGTEFNDTMPTSSVFTIGTAGDVNTNGDNYIAYCWKNIKGYSKIGSYTGNGNANGPFVYTGFKPAFVLFKITNTTGNWYLNDTTRRSINVNSYTLFPNLSNAETTTGAYIDMLSNGFKLRDTGSAINGSGNSFIYMAFAEEPLVGDNPATAR